MNATDPEGLLNLHLSRGRNSLIAHFSLPSLYFPGTLGRDGFYRILINPLKAVSKLIYQTFNTDLAIKRGCGRGYWGGWIGGEKLWSMPLDHIIAPGVAELKTLALFPDGSHPGSRQARLNTAICISATPATVGPNAKISTFCTQLICCECWVPFRKKKKRNRCLY